MKSLSFDLDANKPVVEFREVSIDFEKVQALKDIGFKLSKGQMIVITGASLSGKSVLLHAAIGLLAVEQGDIFIDGQAITSLHERELLELRAASIGITFQEDTLFSSLTVYENAAYRLTERGWSDEDTDRAVLEILGFVGLEKDMEKLPEELSIGMRRRLEIARALIGWPPIMLFDEPTSGLDPISARQVLDLIIRARDIHKISSLYVTKELHEIPYLDTHYATRDESGKVVVCKREAQSSNNITVMVLETGRLIFLGTAAEFAKSSLPGVLQLTHPEGTAPTTDSTLQPHGAGWSGLPQPFDATKQTGTSGIQWTGDGQNDAGQPYACD
jgi:phospholipid/cholesterol/gamma-HCH transport system ATP-binding protein